MSYEFNTLGDLLSNPKIRPVAQDAIRRRNLKEEELWNMTLSQLKEEHFFSGEISNGIKVISQESADNSVRLFQAQNGVLFVTVNDAAKATDYTVYLYDTAGHILGQHAFNGATTAIRLPQGAKGMVVLKVESNKGFKGAAKAMVK